MTNIYGAPFLLSRYRCSLKLKKLLTTLVLVQERVVQSLGYDTIMMECCCNFSSFLHVDSFVNEK